MELNIEFKNLIQAREVFDLLESMISNEGLELQENFLIIGHNCNDQDLAKKICLDQGGILLINVQKVKI